MDRYFIEILTLKSEMNFRGYTEDTQTTYSRYVKDFLNYVKKDSIDITKNDVLRYLRQKRIHESKNTTVVRLNALDFYYSEVLGLAITLNINEFRREVKQKRLITIEEIDTLIGYVDIRYKVIYSIVKELGKHAKNIRGLTVRHFKVNETGWYLDGNKISEDLARLITEYIERNEITKNLFISREGKVLDKSVMIRNIKDHTLEYLGISYTFSDIIHSVGYELWKQGKKDEAVKFVGNKNIHTFKQYYKNIGYSLED